MDAQPMTTEPMAEMRRRLPLPSRLTIARYCGDMRELVQYVIHDDRYHIRYDWIDHDGRPVTSKPGPVDASLDMTQVEVYLQQCRAALLEHRKDTE